MTINTQLKSFLLFFVFGIILYIINHILHYIIKKSKLIYLVLPMFTIVFMIVLYNINSGKIHIYFIAIMILGILFSKISVKQAKNIIFKLKSHIYK